MLFRPLEHAVKLLAGEVAMKFVGTTEKQYTAEEAQPPVPPIKV
jgi:hypothetical protein